MGGVLTGQFTVINPHEQEVTSLIATNAVLWVRLPHLGHDQPMRGLINGPQLKPINEAEVLGPDQ